MKHTQPNKKHFFFILKRSLTFKQVSKFQQHKSQSPGSNVINVTLNHYICKGSYVFGGFHLSNCNSTFIALNLHSKVQQNQNSQTKFQCPGTEKRSSTTDNAKLMIKTKLGMPWCAGRI